MRPETLTAKIAERAPSTGDRPAHYRLSTATWEIILGEYMAGATVTELCVKWRVSMHGIRKRITQHGATKRDHGDRMAVAQAQAWAEAERTKAEASPEARAKRLFDADPDEGEDMGDPAALARLATLASGRAMKGRLWNEAKALAGLAESYGRVGERTGAGSGGSGKEGGGGGGGFTLEDLSRVIFDLEYRLEVMDMSRDAVSDPVKRAYWERKADDDDRRGEGFAAIMNQGYRQGREEAMQAMGLEPRADEPDEFMWYHNTLCRRRMVEGKRRSVDQGSQEAADAQGET